MNVELFIHGVPKGKDFWGKEEDREYFAKFYNDNNKEDKFLIEVRKINNKTYCYYHYLNGKNMVDIEGRTGSYFGMSLRVDCFCKNIKSICDILGLMYRNHIRGTFLNDTGNNVIRYISDFSSKEKEIKEIEALVCKEILGATSEKDFLPIDNSFAIGANVFRLNWNDYKEDTALSAIKKYSKIAISSEYTTNRENSIQASCKKQLEDMQNKNRKDTEDLQKTISKQVKEIQQQYTEIQKLNAENQNLTNEYNSCKDECHSRATAEQYVSQIKINTILLILLLILQLYVVFIGNKNDEPATIYTESSTTEDEIGSTASKTEQSNKKDTTIQVRKIDTTKK